MGARTEKKTAKGSPAELARQNAQLRLQLGELRLANRELELFSQSISHDLRSSLTRIFSSGQALREYGEILDENGLFFVNSINDGCAKLADTLDALLALSRATEAELVSDRVDLSLVARDAVRELRLAEPDRPVLCRIAPQLLVQGDPRLLPIALENLLANAWKYTSYVPQPEIELGSYGSSDGETVFFLKDNGVGFDGARSDQLFKPFQRLHSPSAFPGHGLGLATVRRIIRRHNGRIWGEGRPGQGATFFFTVNG
jgi:signal transduction histidine kinase